MIKQQFASWKLFKGPLSGWQCVFSLLGFEKDAFLDTQDQVRWDKCAKVECPQCTVTWRA